MKILVCFPFSAAERGTLDAIARSATAATRWCTRTHPATRWPSPATPRW